MEGSTPPQVLFDLPSDTDAAQQVVDACGLDLDGSATYDEDGEAPDDVRAAIGDALRATYGGWVEPWDLLPRRVEYTGRVEVTLVRVKDVYEDPAEQPVAPGPRLRLKATLTDALDEGQDGLPEYTLLSNTPGDINTLREELAELERRGEVYQPEPNHYRLADRTVEGDGGA